MRPTYMVVVYGGTDIRLFELCRNGEVKKISDKKNIKSNKLSDTFHTEISRKLNKMTSPELVKWQSSKQHADSCTSTAKAMPQMKNGVLYILHSRGRIKDQPSISFSSCSFKIGFKNRKINDHIQE